MKKCEYLLEGNICAKSKNSRHQWCCILCLFEKGVPFECLATCKKVNDDAVDSLGRHTVVSGVPCSIMKEILKLSKVEQLIAKGWVKK